MSKIKNTGAVTFFGTPSGVGTTGVDVQDETIPVLTPASTLNFTGNGVVVTDAGGGVADVTVTGFGIGDVIAPNPPLVADLIVLGDGVTNVKTNANLAYVVGTNTLTVPNIDPGTYVGLENVDNTADVNKPISLATQTALDLKLDLAGGAVTGAVTSTASWTGTTFNSVALTAGGGGSNFLADDGTYKPNATGTAWGDITGTLADQSDLQLALDDKIPTIISSTDNSVALWTGVSGDAVASAENLTLTAESDHAVLRLKSSASGAYVVIQDSVTTADNFGIYYEQGGLISLAFDGVGSAQIHNSGGDLLITASTNNEVIVEHPGDDTNEVFALDVTGTNGAKTSFFSTTRNPVGNIVGNPGDIAFRENAAASELYIHKGAVANNTGWETVATDVGTFLPLTGGAMTGPITTVSTVAGFNIVGTATAQLQWNTANSVLTLGDFVVFSGGTITNSVVAGHRILDAASANTLRAVLLGRNIARTASASITDTVVVGHNTLTGGDDVTRCVHVGGNSFQSGAIGFTNTSLGYGIAPLVTSSDSNTFIGGNVATSLTTGSGNTVIGASALDGITTATNCIFLGLTGLGDNLIAPTTTPTSYLNIGGLIYGNLSTTLPRVRIGGDQTQALEVSATLELTGTGGGLLHSRGTLAQRNGLAAVNPATEYYNTTTRQTEVWDGLLWQSAMPFYVGNLLNPPTTPPTGENRLWFVTDTGRIATYDTLLAAWVGAEYAIVMNDNGTVNSTDSLRFGNTVAATGIGYVVATDILLVGATYCRSDSVIGAVDICANDVLKVTANLNAFPTGILSRANLGNTTTLNAGQFLCGVWISAGSTSNLIFVLTVREIIFTPP